METTLNGITVSQGKLARAHKMTWKQIERVIALMGKMEQDLMRKYPHLASLMADLDSQDTETRENARRQLSMDAAWPEYNSQLLTCACYPWLLNSIRFGNEDSEEPVTESVLDDSLDEELHECMIAVARLHQHRLPDMPQRMVLLFRERLAKEPLVPVGPK